MIIHPDGYEPCSLSTLTPSYELYLNNYTLCDEVIEYRGIVSQAKHITCSGEYVELFNTCQTVQYGILLAACKPVCGNGAAFCLVQALQPIVANEEQLLNDCDCALYELSNTIIATEAPNIKRAVSFVHQCTATCIFEEGPTLVQIEREQLTQSKLHFKHDYSNNLYCYNRYCILPS